MSTHPFYVVVTMGSLRVGSAAADDVAPVGFPVVSHLRRVSK